jgi:hypothetical protein
MNKLEQKLKEVESWACCEYPARAIRAEYNVDVLTQSVNWYKARVDALQQWMMTIPEPFRGECSDIIANGKIAPWRIRLTPVGVDAALPPSSEGQE